jgi:hypothetical protein
MVSAATSKQPSSHLFSLIEHKSLFARLCDEIMLAAGEFTRDPRGFIRDLFSAEAKDSNSRSRFYAGLICAALAHVSLLVVIVIAGWHRVLVMRIEPSAARLTMIKVGAPAGLGGSSKAELSRGEIGGGGGDRSNPKPASKGLPPPTLPQPQIVKPDPSNLVQPSLPVPSTLVGPVSEPPLPEAPTGVETGKPSQEFARGSGSGEGLGGGSGSGQGLGTGPGKGRGHGVGESGRARAGASDGAGVPREVDYNQLPFIPGSTGIVWIYRPTPIITPEAQANKVSGEAQLRATFRSDGTITDIEVINTVPYMTESIIDALKRSKFRPATINGVPVTVRKVIVRIRVSVYRVDR